LDDQRNDEEFIDADERLQALSGIDQIPMADQHANRDAA
jgi:hypothetical protein